MNTGQNHPVIEAITTRWEHGSRPGQRTDGFTIGLAIEGGSMRGVVSAGMVTGLEFLGLLPCFDVVYGTSAGAINGAYFLAGQAAYGTTIYYENINNSSFIDLSRPFRGRPVASLEFIFEHVVVREKILDWQRVVNSPIPLRPVASSISRALPIVLDGFTTREDLFVCLKASSRMALVAGPPVRVGNDEYLDGSVFASIPFRQAIEGGCTHVLALLTRPSGHVPEKASPFDRYIVAPALRRYNPRLPKAVTERLRHYSEDIEFLVRQTEAPTRQPYLFAVRPARGTAPVGRLEKRRDRLVAGAGHGLSAIMRAFSCEPNFPLEILRPFDEAGHPICGPRISTTGSERTTRTVPM
jgi:predicted patatin/cPLA2 family phospholipase